MCRVVKAPMDLEETRETQARRATRDTKETLDLMVFPVWLETLDPRVTKALTDHKDLL